MRAVRRGLIVGLAAVDFIGLGATVVATAATAAADDPTTGVATAAARLAFLVVFGIGVASFAIVGVLLVWRREHRMGWVFGVIGAGIGIGIATSQYNTAALLGAVPADAGVAWVSQWLTLPTLAGGVVAVLLLFPTGHLPTRRWRPVGWSAFGVIATWAFVEMFHPRLEDAGNTPNPLPVTLPLEVAAPVGAVAETIVVVGFLAGVVAIVRRFRSARGVERQQLKWFTFAAGMTGVGLTTMIVALLWPPLEPLANLGWLFGMLGLASIPIAAGIAILRYRLYDIDLIIRRTLVYGTLTVTLAAVYVGSVILLQGLLSGFTGGNSVAVAASTLGVAALFGPIRRRIQRGVDRRFYRSRYDAQRTLETFSARLRDELDLAHLTDELRGVVGETLQPVSLSVWLRRSDAA